MHAHSLAGKFPTKTQLRFEARKKVGASRTTQRERAHHAKKDIQEESLLEETTGLPVHAADTQTVDALVHTAQQAITDAIIAMAEQHTGVSVVSEHTQPTQNPVVFPLSIKKEIRKKTTLIDGVAINDAVSQLSQEPFVLTDILTTYACRLVDVSYTEEMRHEVHLALRTHAWSVSAQLPRRECGDHSWADVVGECASAYVRFRGVCRETLINDIIHLNAFYPSEGKREYIHDALSDVFIKKVIRPNTKKRVHELLEAVSKKYFEPEAQHHLSRFNEDIVRAVCNAWALSVDEALFLSGTLVKKTKQKKGVLVRFFRRQRSTHTAVDGFSLPEHVII